MIISCLPPKSTHYHASQTCDSLQILLHTFYQLSADCKMHQVILTWSLHVGLSTVSWPHDTNITWENTLLFFVKRGCFLHNMYYCYGCHHYRKLSYRGSDVIMLFCKLVKSTPFSDLDEKINPFHWLYDNMTYMGPSLRNMTLTRHLLEKYVIYEPLLEKYDIYEAPPWGHHSSPVLETTFRRSLQRTIFIKVGRFVELLINIPPTVNKNYPFSL